MLESIIWLFIFEALRSLSVKLENDIQEKGPLVISVYPAEVLNSAPTILSFRVAEKTPVLKIDKALYALD